MQILFMCILITGPNYFFSLHKSFFFLMFWQWKNVKRPLNTWMPLFTAYNANISCERKMPCLKKLFVFGHQNCWNERIEPILYTLKRQLTLSTKWKSKTGPIKQGYKAIFKHWFMLHASLPLIWGSSQIRHTNHSWSHFLGLWSHDIHAILHLNISHKRKCLF